MNTTYPRLVCLLLLPLLLGACVSVRTTESAAFATAVSAARDQTRAAFDTVEALTLPTAIDRAVKEGNLTVVSQTVVPSHAARAAWDQALGDMARYAQHLSDVMAAKDSADLDSAVGDLAKEIQNTSGKQVNPGLASAFSALANGLLRARAQKQAFSIAADVDPEIRNIFKALADQIGDKATPGLRGTAAENWNDRITNLETTFRFSDEATRRPMVVEYVKLVAERDACDAQLLMLRQTYLALADAHTALAAGDGSTVRGTLNFITAELKHARDLQATYAQTLKK
jgi:hypothetical protein